ncbi:monovalent cation/H+ antiporter complex subunit F [Pontibacterium sp.]|uniref:monovalent cation/H+ antiporter complex subunit F n=1 Tax=Pontibacterium sp. TaxID=2036026 RepID=UPI003512C60E
MSISTLAVLALNILLAAVIIGLLRAFWGASLEDRMLSVLLIGTGGVAITLLLSFALAAPALLDVALVMALLAAVAVIALTKGDASDD